MFTDKAIDLSFLCFPLADKDISLALADEDISAATTGEKNCTELLAKMLNNHLDTQASSTHPFVQLEIQVLTAFIAQIKVVNQKQGIEALIQHLTALYAILFYLEYIYQFIVQSNARLNLELANKIETELLQQLSLFFSSTAEQVGSCEESSSSSYSSLKTSEREGYFTEMLQSSSQDPIVVCMKDLVKKFIENERNRNIIQELSSKNSADSKTVSQRTKQLPDTFFQQLLAEMKKEYSVINLLIKCLQTRLQKILNDKEFIDNLVKKFLKIDESKKKPERKQLDCASTVFAQLLAGKKPFASVGDWIVFEEHRGNRYGNSYVPLIQQVEQQLCNCAICVYAQDLRRGLQLKQSKRFFSAKIANKEEFLTLLSPNTLLFPKKKKNNSSDFTASRKLSAEVKDANADLYHFYSPRLWR